MNKIAVVIPTYNRKRHLTLTLLGLLHQANQNFEVVVADDGSTDGTYRAVMEVAYVNPWFAHGLQLKYYRHEHEEGVERQVALARNQGARLVAKGTSHILFLDGEVVLNPMAIGNYYELILVKPDVVVCGRYDWLPPMMIQQYDIIHRWSDFITGNLPRQVVTGPHSMEGFDPRRVAWDDGTEHTTYGGTVLSGNLLIPIEAFHKTGGFDENLKERGQDCEFGYALQFAGFRAIFSEKVIGYHINHEMSGREGRLSEIRAIKYIHRKYNLPLDENQLPPVV